MDLRTSDRTCNVLSLCAGVGSLDLGVKIAVPNAVCCAYVEREAFACEILATRMQQGVLAEAPIWTDLTTFRGRPWLGIVDLIIAGFPCQPFSVAGARLGSSDERHLWPEILRIIREVRPGAVFLENVPGLVQSLTLEHDPAIMRHLAGLHAAAQAATSARDRWRIERHAERLEHYWLREFGVSQVLLIQSQLESLGFRCVWGLFSAAEVGAPQRRERFFCLAHDPQSRGWRVSEPEGWDDSADTYRSGSCVGDTHKPRADDTGPFPPGPGDRAAWARVLAERPWLAPAIKSSVCGVVAESPVVVDESRVDQLRAGGNSVVPLCAAKALVVLAGRLGVTP